MTCSLCLPLHAHAQAIPEHQQSNPWFRDASNQLEGRLAAQAQPTEDRAKNVILFVGDGMGLSTLTATRIHSGQLRGESGEEALLSFEAFSHSALVKTYNVDAQIPDSAGTMTAMVTGVKTNAGVVGVDEFARRGDCESQAGRQLESLLELAELKGLATGIVTTTRLTHATPAAVFANSVDRGWEDDSVMPEQAISQGCIDIARQFIDFEARVEQRHTDADIDGIDVAMGGGRRHFLPATLSSERAAIVGSVAGRRTDNRDLVALWQQREPDGHYLFDRAGFEGYDPEQPGAVLGLFNDSHLRYALDNPDSAPVEPSLAEMTRKAIQRLDNNGAGYVLIVEAGRIDHAHHAGNAHSALADTLALDDAVRAALDTSNVDETLMLVTADHGHVMSHAGFPRRGNAILGKVIGVNENAPRLAADGLPYTTLSYSNGRGFRDFGNATDADASYASDLTPGRVDLSAVTTTATGFHQEALVPLEAESHSGEDVTLHAQGPGARLVSGVMEQNVIFHIINRALRLTSP